MRNLLSSLFSGSKPVPNKGKPERANDNLQEAQLAEQQAALQARIRAMRKSRDSQFQSLVEGTTATTQCANDVAAPSKTQDEFKGKGVDWRSAQPQHR